MRAHREAGARGWNGSCVPCRACPPIEVGFGPAACTQTRIPSDPCFPVGRPPCPVREESRRRWGVILPGPVRAAEGGGRGRGPGPRQPGGLTAHGQHRSARSGPASSGPGESRSSAAEAEHRPPPRRGARKLGGALQDAHAVHTGSGLRPTRRDARPCKGRGAQCVRREPTRDAVGSPGHRARRSPPTAAGDLQPRRASDA